MRKKMIAAAILFGAIGTVGASAGAAAAYTGGPSFYTGYGSTPTNAKIAAAEQVPGNCKILGYYQPVRTNNDPRGAWADTLEAACN
jgi:hypothetical protein